MSEPCLQRIDAAGQAVQVDFRTALMEGEAAHRELRPALPGVYAAYLRMMFAEGARMMQLADEGEVRAIAVWRVFHTTYGGCRLEVDDLVTRERDRSRGYGATLLKALEGRARRLGCAAVMLNSGTFRERAHAFYFRQGFVINAFHFEKATAS